MFRLDNDYYQSIARGKGLSATTPIDERYVKGAHTKSVSHFSIGGGHH